MIAVPAKLSIRRGGLDCVRCRPRLLAKLSVGRACYFEVWFLHSTSPSVLTMKVLCESEGFVSVFGRYCVCSN